MPVDEERLVNLLMAGGALLLGVFLALTVTGLVEWLKERMRWK